MDSNAMSEGLDGAMSTATTLVSTWGISVVGAIALLIVGRIGTGWIRRSITKALTKSGTDSSLIPFFASLAYYVVLALVLSAVLNLFGIETTSLIAVFGAAGLAVGLALQGTLSNFAAGVMLLIFRPIRVGDFVEVAGQAGTVAEISIFSTLLNTGDNVRITIPNAQVYGDTVKNYSFNDTRRIDLIMESATATILEPRFRSSNGSSRPMSEHFRIRPPRSPWRNWVIPLSISWFGRGAKRKTTGAFVGI